MGSDYRNELVFLQEIAGQLVTEEIGTSPHFVGHHNALAVSSLGVHRVRPHQVAEQPTARDLVEAVDVVDVIQVPNFMGDAAVDAEETIIYEAAEGQGVKEVHYQVVGLLPILLET